MKLLKKISGLAIFVSLLFWAPVITAAGTELSIDYMFSGDGSEYSSKTTTDWIEQSPMTNIVDTYSLPVSQDNKIKGAIIGIKHSINRFEFKGEYGDGGDLRLSELKVGYRLLNGERWAFSPTFARQNLEATDFGEFKTENNTVGFELSYKINERLNFKTSLGYGLGKSKTSGMLSYYDVFSVNNEEKMVEWEQQGYRNLKLGIEYQFRPNSLLNLGYRMYQYEYEYSGNDKANELDDYQEIHSTFDRKFNFWTLGVSFRFGDSKTKTVPESTPVVEEPLTITKITPVEGFNNGLILAEITGSGFRDGMNANLSKGNRKIEGQIVELVDSNHIRCRFDLDSHPSGVYDLTVTRRDGKIAVLTKSFTIKEFAPPKPSINLTEINRSLEPVFFDFDSAELREDQVVKADHLLQLLKDYPDLQAIIQVNGHADARGPADYNLKLSQRRGEAVRDYLAMKGIDLDRIKVIACGENYPAVEGEGEAVWRQNRRVELFLTEMEAELTE